LPEKLESVFSIDSFESHEIEEITKALSNIVPVEKRYYIEETVPTIPPEILIFSIGFVSGAIATGFFHAMGSDLYEKFKETVVSILKRKNDPTLTFELSYKDTKITITCRTNDEKELNKVFDTIDKARNIAINELDKAETPKMTEIAVSYEKDWNLHSGQNWNPPKVIKLYRYNKKTDNWELTDDWSQD